VVVFIVRVRVRVRVRVSIHCSDSNACELTRHEGVGERDEEL
jgi:hypothetical protein